MIRMHENEIFCRPWDESLVYARQTGEGSCATLANGSLGGCRDF